MDNHQLFQIQFLGLPLLLGFVCLSSSILLITLLILDLTIFLLLYFLSYKSISFSILTFIPCSFRWVVVLIALWFKHFVEYSLLSMLIKFKGTFLILSSSTFCIVIPVFVAYLSYPLFRNLNTILFGVLYGVIVNLFQRTFLWTSTIYFSFSVREWYSDPINRYNGSINTSNMLWLNLRFFYSLKGVNLWVTNAIFLLIYARCSSALTLPPIVIPRYRYLSTTGKPSIYLSGSFLPLILIKPLFFLLISMLFSEFHFSRSTAHFRNYSSYPTSMMSSAYSR